MATSSVAEVVLELAPWQRLHPLLDASYPRPPRDVFERVVAASGADGVLGLVMLSPHRKGGHLENLALAPNARGRGIGQQLVQVLLQTVGHEGPCDGQPHPRIPRFFSPFGFQPCGQLADGSIAMLILLPVPAISDPLAQ